MATITTEELVIEETRENWFHRAVQIMRTWFEEEEIDLPEKVRVSVGFAKRARGTQIGWCYPPKAAEDGVNQIFISPEKNDPVEVLAILLHELCHAATPGNKHGAKFGKAARALGLTGEKMTATVPGEALTTDLKELAEDLGEYPHARLLTGSVNGSGGSTRPNTYNVKVSCPDDGFFVRTSLKQLEMGFPSCPCGTEMEI